MFNTLNVNPHEGCLRIRHTPQVPGEPFQVDVASAVEAKRILDILADYDWFQLEHNIKPDFSNAQGLEVFEDGEWTDWYDEESGEGINQMVLKGGKLIYEE